jgi:hypothetical protein
VNAAALAARCRELLGPVAGPVVVVAPGVPALAGALAVGLTIAADGAAATGAVVAFLRTPARPAERQRTLRELQSRLEADAPLVLVDHNQPRARWHRVLATLALAAARVGPARGRYPAARELAAIGFRVERLVLAAGERVQLVRARR